MLVLLKTKYKTNKQQISEIFTEMWCQQLLLSIIPQQKHTIDLDSCERIFKRYGCFFGNRYFMMIQTGTMKIIITKWWIIVHVIHLMVHINWIILFFLLWRTFFLLNMTYFAIYINFSSLLDIHFVFFFEIHLDGRE